MGTPIRINRASALVIIVLLIGGLSIFLSVFTQSSEREPIYEESHLIAAGMQVHERSVTNGEHGKMIELSGEFDGQSAFAIIHTGDERGWTGVSESWFRAQEIRDEIPEPDGEATELDNVWIVCRLHVTCDDLKEALERVPVER